MKNTVGLKKDQAILLQENAQETPFDFSTITIEIGCRPLKQNKGLLGKIRGNKGEKLVLDAAAFLLNKEYKIANLGKSIQTGSAANINLYHGDVVYFHSMKHPSGHVWLSCDYLAPKEEINAEHIFINLSSLEENIHKIVFVISIFQGHKKKQDFSKTRHTYITAKDKSGREMARYELPGATALKNMHSLVLAELYREGTSWKFKAAGTAYKDDSFKDILESFR